MQRRQNRNWDGQSNPSVLTQDSDNRSTSESSRIGDNFYARVKRNFISIITGGMYKRSMRLTSIVRFGDIFVEEWDECSLSNYKYQSRLLYRLLNAFDHDVNTNFIHPILHKGPRNYKISPYLYYDEHGIEKTGYHVIIKDKNTIYLGHININSLNIVESWHNSTDKARVEMGEGCMLYNACDCTFEVVDCRRSLRWIIGVEVIPHKKDGWVRYFDRRHMGKFEKGKFVLRLKDVVEPSALRKLLGIKNSKFRDYRFVLISSYIIKRCCRRQSVSVRNRMESSKFGILKSLLVEVFGDSLRNLVYIPEFSNVSYEEFLLIEPERRNVLRLLNIINNTLGGSRYKRECENSLAVCRCFISNIKNGSGFVSLKSLYKRLKRINSNLNLRNKHLKMYGDLSPVFRREIDVYLFFLMCVSLFKFNHLYRGVNIDPKLYCLLHVPRVPIIKQGDIYIPLTSFWYNDCVGLNLDYNVFVKLGIGSWYDLLELCQKVSLHTGKCHVVDVDGIILDLISSIGDFGVVKIELNDSLITSIYIIIEYNDGYRHVRYNRLCSNRLTSFVNRVGRKSISLLSVKRSETLERWYS